MRSVVNYLTPHPTTHPIFCTSYVLFHHFNFIFCKAIFPLSTIFIYSSKLYYFISFMWIKSSLQLVLYMLFDMPTLDKTYLILSYLSDFAAFGQHQETNTSDSLSWTIIFLHHHCRNLSWSICWIWNI
jgi:hypothetical protein